jgi:nucleotide-binding universal stress UspA family protein
MFSPKTILVPTDFSTFSTKALKQAVDIAKQHKSKIHLLHVIAVIQTCAIDYCFDEATLLQLEAKSSDSSRTMMEKQVKEAVKGGDVEIVLDIRKGTPSEEILKEQQEKKIDLIVIASHGSTGLLHQLMGSVASKVTKGAKCPVLVVKS